jgi:homoserine kinase type II
VLTVFERLGFEQLPFYLGLMQHLARKGLPVPEPRTDASGNFLHSIAGKPASLVNLLPGESIDAPMLAHCSLLGVTLAHLHDAALDYPAQQPNLRGLDWWAQAVPVVRPHVTPALARRLDDELAFQQRFHAAASTQSLPRGPVHADLFRDNALFDGPPDAPRLSGVFDFYFAGVDHHVYDLAVCINDWCIDLASGRLAHEHAEALLRAYHLHRPMSPAELRALPGMRRAAALRFWLSRLADWHLPREAALLKPKDPAHFERVLVDCVDQPWHPAL